MIRKILFSIFLFLGIANTLLLLFYAFTGQNAYVIGSDLPDFLIYFVLCYLPLGLVGISIGWWALDRFLKPSKKVNYLAIAFCGILVDAVFVVGTFMFASGH